MNNKKNYSEVEFPKVAIYHRNPNRLNNALLPEDLEEIIYFGKCESPSSNAYGHRWYWSSKGITLIHWRDISKKE